MLLYERTVAKRDYDILSMKCCKLFKHFPYRQASKQNYLYSVCTYHICRWQTIVTESCGYDTVRGYYEYRI